jgi:cysteine-rich repeat protein
MHLGLLRGFCLLLGGSYVSFAAGCIQFVEANCDSGDCEPISASTTEDTSESHTTGSTDAETAMVTTSPSTSSAAGSESDTGPDTNTGPETDTGTGPGTDTEPDTDTGPDTGTGTDTGDIVPFCGDGMIDNGEDCDDGDDNSDSNPDACRTNCREPGCGDGVVDAAETCDDQNTMETDGCLSTCVVPTSCAVILAELVNPADGAYAIAPDGTLLTTACDMTTEGGGWTLVGKVNNASQGGVSEPVGWFGTAINANNLASPDLTLNESPESHGAARFSPIISEGTSLTRFELIQGGAVTESVEWFKIVGTTASFEAWFGETDPDSSNVCTDAAMTNSCDTARIQRIGNEQNNVTVLGGMVITDYFPDGDDFPIHIRQDNNSSNGTSGVISGTLDVPEWNAGYGNQSGNGLRIWLRE